ncbi:MAG TPA: hypothetical protein VK001_08725, partial [Geminicoccaceae bacterium]|nr:hypothetical protein [Geminicoccaceae bacterium]
MRRFSNTAAAPARTGPSRADEDPLRPLLAPVHSLKGVGPRLDAALARLLGAPKGAPARCLDLLWHLPQGAIERRLQDGPAALVEGARVTLLVEVEEHRPGPRPHRFARPRAPYKVRCRTAGASLHLVFFQAREPYLKRALPEGARRVVSGTLGRFGQEWQMVHPELIA